MRQTFGGWCVDVRCFLRNDFNFSPFIVSADELEKLFLVGHSPYDAARNIVESDKHGKYLANSN